MNHSLIIINGKNIKIYMLDNKTIWNIGRPSKDNKPDISLDVSTISRLHGKFKNKNGYWFYVDGYGKNGTYYNGEYLKRGIGGTIVPKMLSDGDTFLFGGGSNMKINQKTVWGLYLEKYYGENCRVIDTANYSNIIFQDGEDITELYKPDIGTVVTKDNGIGIYMGDVTYIIGFITLRKK